MLWVRSLIDASAHPIAGTIGGTTPRISPDGKLLAFAAAGRTLVIPIQGGEPRRLIPDESPPTTLQWVSPTRLLAITNDGTTLHWLDPEVGATEEKVTLGTRCALGRWIASRTRLLCTRGQGTLRSVTGDTETTIRTRNADGSPGAAVSGNAFRIVDDHYLIYLSVDGDLRAAPYDPRTDLIGRSITLVSGIRADATGTAQMDLTPNGMLGFVAGTSNADVQMARIAPGAEARPLPIERAHFQRFDVTADGRRMAAVVITAEGQELRIYDLRSGQRQTWLRDMYIGGVFWDRRGERIMVRIRNGASAAILLGSPSAANAPDTVYGSADQAQVPELVEYHDETTVLARTTSNALVRFDPTQRPIRFDTLLKEAVFSAISPDGRHLAWQSDITSQLNLSSYPPGSQQQLVALGGSEPLWRSATELLYRAGVTWNIVRLDAKTGMLAGPPTRWGVDPRFLDTPGWSNRWSWDGGIVYVQSPDISDARFLRLIPDFVARMKAAVDKANR